MCTQFRLLYLELRGLIIRKPYGLQNCLPVYNQCRDLAHGIYVQVFWIDLLIFEQVYGSRLIIYPLMS